jgi:site-specific recombinase XerD
VTVGRAIDRFLGELARRGYSARTRDDYFRKLCLLCEQLPNDEPQIQSVTPDDCRGFLDRWREHKPGTRYHSWAVLSSFFRWLYQTGAVESNPMARIEAPKRLRYDEVEVTTVSGAAVRRLFDACETWAGAALSVDARISRPASAGRIGAAST